MHVDKPLKIIFLTGFTHAQGTYFRWHNWAISLLIQNQEISVYTFDTNTASSARTEVRDGVTYHIFPSAKGQGVFGHYAHPVNILKSYFGSLPKADIIHEIGRAHV